MQIVMVSLSCQIIEEQQMNTDPKKWNPFKFLRGSARKPDADGPQSPPASEPWHLMTYEFHLKPGDGVAPAPLGVKVTEDA